MTRSQWLMLGGIVMLAAFLRFWQLGSMPPGLYHDEAYNGLDAISLTQGATFPQFYEGWELYSAEAHADRPPEQTQTPLFFEGNYGREPLHVYLMALSVQLFGPTIASLRAVPALAGVLSVLTTFWAARTLWQDGDSDDRANLSLLAAFFVAILFPAIHFSRFALRAMLFVPVETLAVVAFWHGLNSSTKKGRWTGFLIAGAFIGAGLYIYAAARLFPLLFATFMLVLFVRDGAIRRQFLGPMVGLVAMAVLIAAPLLLYFARYPYFFIFRTAFVANKGKGTVEGQPLVTWGLNIGRIIRGLYWQGETHLRHNLPRRPYFDLLQAVWFSLGIIFTMRNFRSRRNLFLLLWLAVMLLPTILSGDAPHFGRMTGALAPISILLGVGLWQSVRWLQTRFQWPRAILIGLPSLVSLLLVTNAYFVTYANHEDLPTGSYPTADGFYLPDWELGQELAALPETTAIYFAPPQAEMATLFYALGGDPARLRSYDGTAGLVPVGNPAHDVVYVIRPTFITIVEQLRGFYGDQMSETWRDTSVLVTVSADADRHPTKNQDGRALTENISLSGWSTHVDGPMLTVRLGWQTTAAVDQTLTAFVHALDADGNIVTQNDHPPQGYPTTSWQRDELIFDTFLLTAPADAQIVALRTGFYDSTTFVPVGEPLLLDLP